MTLHAVPKTSRREFVWLSQIRAEFLSTAQSSCTPIAYCLTPLLEPFIVWEVTILDELPVAPRRIQLLLNIIQGLRPILLWIQEPVRTARIWHRLRHGSLNTEVPTVVSFYVFSLQHAPKVWPRCTKGKPARGSV